MVTVHSAKEILLDDGTTYVRLILQSGIELIRSQRTNNFYATAKKASISSTFDLKTAEQLIGTTLNGSIIKQEVEPYEYELESGEVIELSHRWVYTERTQEELAVDALVHEANAHSNANVNLEEVV